MPPPDLLARFIQRFQRAIGAEMDAMRASLGPFEVVLGAGHAAGVAEEDAARPHLYDFDLPGPNDKLAVGLECSLRTEQSEHLVTVLQLEPGALRLASSTEIRLDQGPCTLVLYPWFLYERLLPALGSLAVAPDLFPQSSLRLFGRIPVTTTDRAVALPHPELNASQRRAVEQCCRSDLAFVWGPPGTGKTRTLGDGDGMSARQTLADQPPFPGHPLVVVDTAGRTHCRTATGSYSRYNEGSADRAVELALAAVSDGLDSVAVITPYAEQARLVRRLLTQAGGNATRVECSTVHRFQGNERDLVLLDTVDAEPLAPGVLLAGQAPGAEAAHLLNVSISRARGKLVILADLAYFRGRASGSAVTELLERAVRMGNVVTWGTEEWRR